MTGMLALNVQRLTSPSNPLDFPLSAAFLISTALPAIPGALVVRNRAGRGRGLASVTEL